MKRASMVLSLLALLSLGLPAPGGADTVLTGQIGKAYYRIVKPDNWNGGLVFWNHGFTLNNPAPVTDMGPLAAQQLAQGYAVAASSYRMRGWALFKTDDDLEDVYNVFVENFGVPGRVIVTGASLGGIVTASALERAQIGNVMGALSLCGALAGSRNWDGAVDARLIYDVLCSAVPGAALPGGAEGLPFRSNISQAQMAGAVNVCFGILLPPQNRTRPQRMRLASFMQLTGLPENFVLTDMGFATFALADLTHDMAKLRRRIGAGNATVVYGDPVVDATIERAWPEFGAGQDLRENFTPRGEVGNARIVSLHTDKDGLVIVENEHEYAEVVPAANLTTAIVVEATPTHCSFSNAETLAAWESLRTWVEMGFPQPTAGSIQNLCQALAPQVGGPCRIDPNFVIPDMDGRIRPR
jgi:hypothetical protein